MPQADGHVRIAGEVKVDLERVRDGADPRRDRCGAVSYTHLSPALSDGLRTVWVVVVLLVSMAFLVGDSYNPFLYFRF